MVRGVALVTLVLATGACSQVFGLDPPTVRALDDAPGADAIRSWWNPDWPYRMNLTITNGSGITLPAGYQVGVARDLDAAPCTSKRDDIRIATDAGEVSRVIDEVGKVEWTWFPLAAPLGPGATTTAYSLYCGNPAPSVAPSDPRTVFDFYDGFESIDQNTWTVSGQVNEFMTLAVCGSTAAQSGLVSMQTFVANHAVDFVAIPQSTMASNWWGGFESGTMDVPPWVTWYTNQPTIIAPGIYLQGDPSAWFGTSVSLEAKPHFFGVERYDTSAMFRLDDVVYGEHIYTSSPPDKLSVRLWNASTAANTVVSFDQVRVRQAVDPPPAVTVGAVETY